MPGTDPLKTVRFRCAACKNNFAGEPSRVVDAPEDVDHPYHYFAICECGAEAGQVAWERNLFRAWRNATGPKTPEGRAASAANLEGHPTPEEALRTRFNAMKHGLNAHVATYFPARPDKYDFCKSCDVDRAWCASQVACAKRTELFMLHHAAFEQKSPRALSQVYASFQAGLFSVVQQMLQSILTDGVVVYKPEVTIRPNGETVVVKFTDPNGVERVVQESFAHPLLKPLSEFLSRNGLSLSDMGMTHRIADEAEQQFGALKDVTDTRQTLGAFAQHQARVMDQLAARLSAAEVARAADPALLEHNGGRAA